MTRSVAERDALYRRVHARCVVEFPDVNPDAACFQLNTMAALELRAHGERALVQAGSLSWPRVTPEQDDGVMATHFSYVWSPTDAPSIAAIRAGRIPEMHVWVALPDRGELIDMTTGALPAQCRKLGGFEWLGPPPPPYLWCAVDAVPDRVLYRPNAQATQFVLALVLATFGPEALRALLNGGEQCSQRE